METENWGRGKIRYHLEQKGYATLTEIDEKFGLSVSTTSDAIRYPKPKGEAVIAKIIGERWSQDFGPVVKMDRLIRKTIHNDETKEPLARFQSQSCA